MAESESRTVPLAPGLPKCCSNVEGRSPSIAPGPTEAGEEAGPPTGVGAGNDVLDDVGGDEGGFNNELSGGI
eukprot:388735-Prorocentrum_minimum.AAC.1